MPNYRAPFSFVTRELLLSPGNRVDRSMKATHIGEGFMHVFHDAAVHVHTSRQFLDGTTELRLLL